MNPEDKNLNNRQEINEVLKEEEQERLLAIARNKKASAPILADLAQAGFFIEWVADLYNQLLNYKNAIPILLKWLPLIENIDVKSDIVRALSVPWAKPVAAKPLIEEFHKMHNESNIGIKWTIANALAVVADDNVFQDIVDLVQDSRNKESRQMLAIALGNIKDTRAVDPLIALLNDDEVAGHAIIALGKLKAVKAIPYIEPFRNHEKTWIRREAKKAISRIERAN